VKLCALTSGAARESWVSRPGRSESLRRNTSSHSHSAARSLLRLGSELERPRRR
jgi:hypothetical protein